MQLNLNISGYEGPLDLLLELSKKQKVDIKKISILELANQYLDFVENNLSKINLSADYLVMASLLAYLKSKLLLPFEEDDEATEIEEDLAQRLIHYNAIKKLGLKIFDLPQEGKDFFNIGIKNEFLISNKIVPKMKLQDLILKYSEIQKKKNTIKIMSDEDQFYTIDKGLEWLDVIFQIKDKKWFFLFNFIPQMKQKIKTKSAIISLLMATLSRVSEGKIDMNQKDHYGKIMVRSKI
mgnify:CR=1 FL=1|tara:strand:- start:925 stop:1635 length:711 start_codon:yes stop_codon:yes gene_type:complete